MDSAFHFKDKEPTVTFFAHGCAVEEGWLTS